jgi:hypothetical protein
MCARLPQATVIQRRSEWAGGGRRSRRWFARVWAKGRPPTRRSELAHRGPPHDNVRVSSFPLPVPDCAHLLRIESSLPLRFPLWSDHHDLQTRALSRRTRGADLSRLEGQIPEVSHGSWFKPQCHAAARVSARFDVVDDQSRLFVAVNIEPCRSPSTSILIFVHCPGTRSTYDSYLLGVSFRRRNHCHSGCEMYCTE